MSQPSPEPGSIIVTGGTGGLGTAVTERLLATGSQVVVPWYDEAEADRLTPHPDLVLVKADLSDENDVERIIGRATADESRPLTGLVNLVGGFHSGSRVHETPVDVLDAQLSLNLRIAYLVTQAAMPELIRRGGGSVVCIGSAAATHPFPGAAGYIASKAAVAALVQSMAVEYAADSIRVNGLVPSMIDTPANRQAMPNADTSTWARPADLAEVIAFLLSDASRSVTGALIPVTGTTTGH
ncbi:SDR family NAD(P)-dependent oxidoreductase [Rhodococcus sp. B50]|uniref:SDR family NAD(P)-dependent oxidoreductase n=1 Tax=Rhodococcus sp. B50 TaxID=2682847 RepID=UPI001BD58951|nr:SDR family oxidoreductase [Rhodococcus sp. B50]MBS9376322.1 2-(R)-hydroxypropyl-CoM dehydrogenase [Rhodococcus sp. B50]